MTAPERETGIPEGGARFTPGPWIAFAQAVADHFADTDAPLGARARELLAKASPQTGPVSGAQSPNTDPSPTNPAGQP